MDSMWHYLIPTLLVIGTIAFMEWFAAWSHEHIMHGWGWNWHKSHHEPHDGVFEKNDLYALVFTAVAIALYVGAHWFWPLRWIALGLTMYGMLYFFMHDGLVHQRWPFKYVPRNGYLKRVYQAHRLHHAVKGREHCVSFGFIYAEPAAVLKKKLQDNARAATSVQEEDSSALQGLGEDASDRL